MLGLVALCWRSDAGVASLVVLVFGITAAAGQAC